jgi:translation initiation factor IF-2
VADNKEKKPLGLKGGTLGLSKSLSDKLSVTPSTRVKSSSSSTNSGRGKVVVVTKTTRGGKTSNALDSGTGYISEAEREKRLRLIKEAEINRKTENERKEKDQQESRSKQQKRSAGTEEIVTQSEPAVEVKEEVPYVEAPQALERVKLRDVNQSGKVKNLNELYRPVKPARPIEPLAENEKAAEKSAEAAIALPSLTQKHGAKKRSNVEEEKEMAAARRAADEKKASRKFTVAQVMMMDSDEPGAVKRRSIASIRRAREKAKRKMMGDSRQTEKIIREVNIPDVLTVGELANRMAEKAADVIKSLMRLGLMVTVNQSIDADTAELVIGEFGHKFKRVTDAEIESALLQKVEDSSESMKFRPPVVTIMGHVDHGKTSLLDALRDTDVVAGEAGGITQHIGAYQVRLQPDKVITFLDTPGHEAFTAMRMRGAKVTDIVVLVVAADDGIMQQTIEAISHAKAANVPIIVAVNKIDKPGADSTRVKNELLQHGLVPEDMGGDTMVIEVSAKQKLNLDKLEEGILIQAEMLDLKANPDRTAEGAVIEAKVDKGRGIVATVLVQKGTLRIGDIIVAGATWGKIRALVNDKGISVTEALPSTPIEILGLSEAPVAGDEFTIVNSEKTARDIILLRQEKEKHRKMVASKSITLDQLFKRAHTENGIKELPIIIKADVQGFC